MSLTATRQSGVSDPTGWLHGLWVYYRNYTQSAIHAGAAAALSAFGLFTFVDPLFAVVAVVSYFCPPVALYILDADVGKNAPASEPVTENASDGTSANDSDTDSDSDDGDTDSDGNDAD